ncbi:MAG: SIR2 family protein [Parvibaculum sp.]|uniref:SIR2 family protein n=1 Tax=Parvibaculum sp. TaxID=2024848 RepID=UPI0028523317|nr:SIR2 family protein [Parvibaculum sp.]MDR3500693.1 SIR2 family protein [Parvibaculum sp.]
MIDIQDAIGLATTRDEIVGYKTRYSYSPIVELVRAAVRRRTLTIVLGAGVSTALKLPQWNELIEDLYTEIYKEIDPTLSISDIIKMREKGYANTTMVRHLETLLGYSFGVRSMARDILYRSFWEKGSAQLIEPLCDIFLRTGAVAPVSHVITYNFDNAVERHLKRLKRKDIVSIYSNATYPLQSGGLRIYHPHGFLPYKDDDLEDAACKESVVFSERDYNLHFMDPGHWANILQLHHFMNRTCLFVGVSLTDPNVRRLLDHAREKTGPVVRHVSIQKTKGSRLADMFVERDFHSLGVATLWVPDYSNIPDVLKACATS